MEDNKEMNAKQTEKLTDEKIPDVNGGETFVPESAICPDRGSYRCKKCRHYGIDYECLKGIRFNGTKGFEQK